MCFRGDLIALRRKHTSSLNLREKLGQAVIRFQEHFGKLTGEIEGLKERHIADVEAKALIHDRRFLKDTSSPGSRRSSRARPGVYTTPSQVLPKRCRSPRGSQPFKPSASSSACRATRKTCDSFLQVKHPKKANQNQASHRTGFFLASRLKTQSTRCLVPVSLTCSSSLS